MLSRIGFYVCIVLYLSIELTPVRCTSPTTIQETADSFIGSDRWSYASSYKTGPNTFKCNIFVDDVFRREGAVTPSRRGWWHSPIGAREWENSHSTYLTQNTCWELCDTPSVGDVLATEGHVGIVTGASTTTSAAFERVVRNDWGFRAGQSPTCWRYQYDNSDCP